MNRYNFLQRDLRPIMAAGGKEKRHTKMPNIAAYGWLAILIATSLCISGQAIAVQAAQQVSVQVVAVDPVNPARKLHYVWRVSEGSISNVDAPVTTWTLPKGPGVHFANVLVSNRLGGYTERRIAVITDDLGISADVSPLKDFFPPISNTNEIQYSETEFVVAAGPNFANSFNAGEGRYQNGTATFKRAVYLPDVTVDYTDDLSNSVFQATSNLSGRLSVWNSGHPICCLDGNFPYGHPHTHVNAIGNQSPEEALIYIAGSVALKDGNICGTDNKFQRVQTTATAVLLDSNKLALGSSVRENNFVDYDLPWNASAQYVQVKCENNFQKTVAINTLTNVANTAIFNTTAAPTVANITASIGGQVLDATSVAKAKFLPPDSGEISSNFPRSDHFLAFKGLDNPQSACEYYRTIGAVKTCNAAGTATGAVTFEDWKAKTGLGIYKNTGVFSGQNAIEYTATYINKIDLNLTRNHHAITYVINGVNRTAAYVCNHLGPATDSQADVDVAIDNAIHGRNLVACVAMDYGYELANGKPYVRFLTFAPNGKLLMSVNLDGRGEKHIPGTCIACHGGSKYDGQFPMNKASADVGAHFLPYDVGNFAFSTANGFTKAQQQKAIYNLNKIAKTTNLTPIATDLINGWYHNDTVTTVDQNYLPKDWQAAIGKLPGINVSYFYKKVEAPYCRSCHVAMDSQRITDNPEDVANWLKTGSPNSDDAFKQVLCGGYATVQRNHSMPNSLVTFNRMWSDPIAVDQLTRWSGDSNCLNRPDPKIK